jgi:DNA-binding transcriptional regulator YdaS (Cro superfamily)
MAALTGKGALTRCVEILGTQEIAAQICGVGQSAISECLRNGKRVPAEWCRPLEAATERAGEKISAHQLRPDLFEAPAKRIGKPRSRGLRTAEARA